MGIRLIDSHTEVIHCEDCDEPADYMVEIVVRISNLKTDVEMVHPIDLNEEIAMTSYVCKRCIIAGGYGEEDLP